MTAWRYYMAVLATIAVAGVGWLGWEQHQQTAQQAEETCIARAVAHNAITLDKLLKNAGTARSSDIPDNVFDEVRFRAETRAILEMGAAMDRCG